MLTAFVQDTVAWLRDYHLRSISESGNSVLKQVYPRPLLKKTEPRRTGEISGRVVSYNVRQLGYPWHQGTDVRWLQRAV